MKNTGNVMNTQNIGFKCENPRNKDIDIIYVRGGTESPKIKKVDF